MDLLILYRKNGRFCLSIDRICLFIYIKFKILSIIKLIYKGVHIYIYIITEKCCHIGIFAAFVILSSSRFILDFFLEKYYYRVDILCISGFCVLF